MPPPPPSSGSRSSEASPLYLDSDDAIARFMHGIAGTRAIAVDTEGASFHRFVDRIYLLQLSTHERSAIIDPLPIASPDALGTILESPDVEVVFHDADYDLRLLHQDYGWHVTKIFDTRIAAQLLGIRAFGLAALLERYFDVKLDKKHQRADWSMRPLPRDMLQYAAQDTRYLLELRERLRNELERAGRASWAAEEFARLEGTRWDNDEDRDAFLRIKGARDLTRRQLAVLRELVPWRDDVARAIDRATFRVVSNEALLEISRQTPQSRESLSAIKGMPRGMLDSRGSEIIAAVERGLAVPETALPKFPRAARWDRDPDFDDVVARLKTVRDAAAERLELDPGVLCARERLEAVARRKPKSLDELAEMPEIRRWQVEQLGAEFIAVLGNGGSRSSGASRSKTTATRTSTPEDSPYRKE